ncbi:MAG TPA: MBL fold metallo-hydrolase [Actinomycetota bacterium]|nr:MBL fold metallo-hydrolase [Actinomycetota bacterium]
MSSSPGIESSSGDTPRPAATVVVVRERGGRTEVLLTRRPKGMRFMGGAMVFPGGAAGPQDGDPRWASAVTGVPHGYHEDDWLTLGVCALRELFEEVGLLLAGERSHAAAALSRRGEGLLDACLASGARLCLGGLVYAGRWVTPPGSPVRFAARFFLVAAPSEWEPVPDPVEVSAIQWATPSEALQQLAEGRVIMAPPTVAMLTSLEGISSFEDAAERVLRHPIGERSGDLVAARLSPLVQVVIAPNPSPMTGPGTNTYILGEAPSLVVDPAVDDERFIGEVLRRAGEVAGVVVTHRHSDHTGGVGEVLSRTGARLYAYPGDDVAGMHPAPLRDRDVVRFGGGEAEVLHTPGHAPDHVSLWLARERALIAGDNVLGEGTSVIAPPGGNMAEYMKTLDRLLGLAPRRIYPGHFRPIDDGEQTLRGYISHRRARESAILKAVQSGASDLDRIVELAYAGTPTDMQPIARQSALAHLELLERQGLVRRSSNQWLPASLTKNE